MRKLARGVILLTGCALLVGGCGGEVKTLGADAGPTTAFKEWVRVVEQRDYQEMWNLMPETAQERYSLSWDAERADLARKTEPVRKRFLEVYGFKSWAELEKEEGEAFFIRAMGRYPKEELPVKYQLLKKAKVHKIIYGDEGASCMVTFLDEDNSPLPMKMKMLKEGKEWKVIRLP